MYPEQRDLSNLFEDEIHATQGSKSYLVSVCDLSNPGEKKKAFVPRFPLSYRMRIAFWRILDKVLSKIVR